MLGNFTFSSVLHCFSHVPVCCYVSVCVLWTQGLYFKTISKQGELDLFLRYVLAIFLNFIWYLISWSSYEVEKRFLIFLSYLFFFFAIYSKLWKFSLCKDTILVIFGVYCSNDVVDPSSLTTQPSKLQGLLSLFFWFWFD